MDQELTPYQIAITEDICETIEDLGLQPILFIGAGLSKRYLNTPSWIELLTELQMKCPTIQKPVSYFVQAGANLIDVGESYSECYFEWAWSDQGKNIFPEELYKSKNKSVYIKYMASKIIKEICEKGKIENNLSPERATEISELKKIKAFSIITTNYDDMVEDFFNEHTSVIGQNIIRANYASVGEILKIHGCYSNFESLVLTRSDYDIFLKKKKYLSAKLLTFFAEHPLFFFGYGVQDPNIKSILSDIDEIISENNDLVHNIYFVEWIPEDKIDIHNAPPMEKIIELENSKSIRIKMIQSSDFSWIYQAISKANPAHNISPKILRSILSRTYNLIRCDIPKQNIEVNYQVLESAAENQDSLAKLYGISNISNPSHVNATFPYTLTQISEALGGETWHTANKLIEKIYNEKGVDIKSSDNRYHISIKNSKKTCVKKYSQELIDLLKKVQSGQDYELDL